VRILGVDPGINNLGWAIVEGSGRSPHHVASGIFSPTDKDTNSKLLSIFKAVEEMLRVYQPERVALESVFVNKNAQSTLRLGEVRAAVIIAASSFGIEVEDFAPRKVKQSITGRGNASKAKVQDMVCAMMGIPKEGKFDRYDAIAIALCGYHQYRRPV